MDVLEATVSQNETTQKQETVTPEGQEGVTGSDVPSNADNAPEKEQEYDIGGKKYKAQDLMAALESHNNKEKWQKEYTQKTQELSAERNKYKNFEAESQRLERTRKIHDILQEHPELARRFKDVERQYYEDLENDPEIKTKVEMTKLGNKVDSLVEQLHKKDVEIRRVQLGADLQKLMTTEGLTTEEATAILQETLEKGHPTLEGAYYTLFKDKILLKARQQAEKEVLEKKRIGHEVKQAKTSGAVPAPKDNGKIPDLEEWQKQHRSKTIHDYLNIYAPE